MARRDGQIIKRGDRTWVVRIYLGRDPGSGKRTYLNRTVHGTSKDAGRLMNLLLRERDLGELLEPSQESLDSYLGRWLETSAKPTLRRSSYEQYVDRLKAVRSALGAKALGRVHARDIQAVYAAMLERKLSPRTIRYSHSVLREALQQALKWNLIRSNPADLVDLPRPKKKVEIVVFSQEEAERFLRGSRGNRWHTLFAVLLATGMRPSEALGLAWSHIDFERLAFRVQRKLTRYQDGWEFDDNKTVKGRRVIDIPHHLADLLLRHRAEQRAAGAYHPGHDLVFSGQAGQPAHRANILRRFFRPELTRLNLDGKMRLYDLRHTHATLLLLANVHPKTVSERLGHASVTITLDTYSHLLPTIQKEASDAIGVALFGRDATAGREEIDLN